MFRNTFILSLVLLSGFSFSQEIISSIPIELKKDTDVFQIVNDSAKEAILFLSDAKRIDAIRLDKKMNIIDSLPVDKLDRKYNEIIGSIENSGVPCIFWSSSNKKEISMQSYDFHTRKVTNHFYTLDFEGEKYLQNFSIKNKFYMLSIVKNSNVLSLYVFDKLGEMTKKSVPLKNFKVYQRNTFYEVLEEDLLPFEPPFSLKKITTDTPTSLSNSSYKRKCYFNDKEIILTIDTNQNYTQLISIDLQNFSTYEKYINNATTDVFKESPSFNSFLIDQKLFQLKVSSSKMIMTIKDYKGTLQKKYEVTDNDEINFKNTPIVQENKKSSNERVINTTNQFLRKLNNLNSGLSCYKLNNNYLLTLGSISDPVTNNSVTVGSMIGGLAGALIAIAISNPVYDNFNSYADRKVVYINCLFDKNNEHVKSEIQPLAFDKIKIFSEQNNNKLNSPTLYKFNDLYYLGHYDIQEKKYLIRLFQD